MQFDKQAGGGGRKLDQSAMIDLMINRKSRRGSHFFRFIKSPGEMMSRLQSSVANS